MTEQIEDPIFNKGAGRYFSVQSAQPLKDSYYKVKQEAGLKETEFVRSEFFGLDKIRQLISHDHCVGIRVHYAKRWENEDGRETSPEKGKLSSRLLLTAVDAKGRDILDDPTGLKDGDGGGIVGEGWTCPRQCGS